jgi:hypothetical protein
VNSATINALNAANERQFLGERGLPKLKANTMNTTEFKTTHVQRP